MSPQLVLRPLTRAGSEQAEAEVGKSEEEVAASVIFPIDGGRQRTSPPLRAAESRILFEWFFAESAAGVVGSSSVRSKTLP